MEERNVLSFNMAVTHTDCLLARISHFPVLMFEDLWREWISEWENYRKTTVRLGERYLAYHSSIGNAKSPRVYPSRMLRIDQRYGV